MLFTIHLVTMAESSLGRPNKSTMPQQTLMELLVSNFDDVTFFHDSDGSFKDLSIWADLGVTLTPDGEVDKIDWEEGLGGLSLFDSDEFDAIPKRIPKQGGSIDLHWLPSSLTEFHIPELELSGTIDTFDLPRGLQIFDVDENAFTGSFDTSGLPNCLNIVYMSLNKLSGSLDLKKLPSVLKSLYAQNNGFSGTLDFSNLPKCIKNLNLSSNGFIGKIDLSLIPDSITFLRLEGNSFDRHKVMTVRKYGAGHFYLDKGDIEEVINTDGTPIKFEVIGSDSIRLL